tara:strand:- start:1896 stop:2123 length:228 start_codon:yes stop_codon:yes gene_type:complete
MEVSEVSSKGKLATLKETAEYLNVSINTIRNYIKKDVIPYMTVGGSYRFDLEQVRDYINDQDRFARSSKPTKEEE